MFNFGDLDVLTAAEIGIDTFQMISDPIEFKKAMLDAKHEFEVDMERQSWPPSPPLEQPATGPGLVRTPDDDDAAPGRDAGGCRAAVAGAAAAPRAAAPAGRARAT